MLPSQAVALICVCIVFPVLSTIAVGLRVYARQLTNIKLNASDYFIFFTLLNAILNAITCIIGAVACGIGLPLSELSDYVRVRFLKILFVTQFFYVLSVFSVKVSVVLFYKSIFITPGFRRAANATLAILGTCIIAFFFVTLFQDKPIARNWGAPGTAVNWRILYLVEIVVDITLDVFILCMPLPVISRLHMNRKKKWLVGGIFWLGAFIVVASTVRMYYIIQFIIEYKSDQDDFSFTSVNTIIWGAIEPCASVVAACLPIIGAVIFRKRQSPVTTANSRSPYFRKEDSTPSRHAARPLRGISSESAEPLGNSTLVNDGYSAHSANGGNDKSSHSFDHDARVAIPNGIKVTRDVIVSKKA